MSRERQMRLFGREKVERQLQDCWEDRMGWQVGCSTSRRRLAALSKNDLKRFRPELVRPVSKGGRPPFDHLLMFKVLVLQT